jgi:hypothetical protein
VPLHVSRESHDQTRGRALPVATRWPWLAGPTGHRETTTPKSLGLTVKRERESLPPSLGLRDRSDLTFATDPDADRHGIVSRSTGLLKPNRCLTVALR